MPDSSGLTADLKARLGCEVTDSLRSRFEAAITELRAAGLSYAALEQIVQEGAPLKPTVGRMVHYVSHGTPGGEYKSECRAAVVTEVEGRA